MNKSFTIVNLDLKYFTNADAILQTQWSGLLEH